MSQSTAIRICIDLGIFSLLASKSPRTSADLAVQSGAQEVLLTRLMRQLTTGGFAHEIEVSTFAANGLTHALANPQVAAGVLHWFDRGMLPCYKMPEYFKKRDYKLPDDEVSGPQQYAMGTDLESYTYWATIPGWMESFNTYMTGVILDERGSWTDFYPVKEKLLDEFRENQGDGYLFVDVGGGRGHDAKLFKEKTTRTSIGKLALEDLPAVIEDVPNDLDSSIERVKQDFFQEQKIKGKSQRFGVFPVVFTLLHGMIPY